MTATVIRGDAAHLPLPDASVDLIVTSPPYWSLRSYTDAGEHYDGQIGAEATPAAYVDSLIDCTREWMRVLKPTGSMWVNLGDKYNSSPRGNAGNGTSTLRTPNRNFDEGAGRAQILRSLPAKSLIGLPWRYAIRCIDDLGLTLRAEVIWSKPNGLPESVTDRVRRSHETWFHLVKSPRYFSAVDAIRDPHAGEFLSSGVRNPRHGRPGGMMPWEQRGDVIASADRVLGDGRADGHKQSMGRPGAKPALSPLGKLPGSVWEIATQPLKVPDHLGVDHFAAFPMEWPRRIIQGWSPSGICTACGEGRRPVVTKSSHSPPSSADRVRANGHSGYAGFGDSKQWIHAKGAHPREGSLYDLTGDACACPDTSAPTRPSVIVDPFGGTGTTSLVASALGRHGISVDMSADYCRLAAWRTTDPGQLAAALQVEKPAVQHVGQSSLLDLLTVGTEGDAA